jgi:predicted PurR-regulated permease PerM
MGMEKKTEEAELLQKIMDAQQRSVRSARITAIAVVVLVAALVVSLMVLVPSFLNTMNEAHVTMENTQELIRRANTSLEKLDSMAENVDDIVREGGENMGRVIEVLDAIDLEALSNSIRKFSQVIDSLSNFKLFG